MIRALLSLFRTGWRQERPSAWMMFLQAGASATLVARGWLTWRWDSPIRGLAWQEEWWSGLLEKQFDIPWSTFAKASDPYITSGLLVIGALLIAIGFVPWIIIHPRLQKLRGLLWLGSALLALDSIARWVGKDYDFGMAIEHSLQILAPIALFLATSGRANEKVLTLLLGVGSAFTFIGHGLYAIGFHPVPLSYQTMTMKLLSLGSEGTIRFLFLVGALDLVAAAALLIRPLRVAGLLYMTAWGFLTALARVASHVGASQPLHGLDPWIAETLVRTSHWLLPLLLLGLLPRREEKLS